MTLLLPVACSAETPPPAEDVPSYDGRNRALSFDGANDYAITGSSAFPLSNEAHTIAFWARPALVAAATATDGGSAPDDRQAMVTLRKDFESGVVVGVSRGAFEAWSIYSDRTYVRASGPAVAGVWQHLAYTFDGTTHRLFVDGQPQDESKVEVNHRTNTSGWLGSTDGFRNLFVGDLDLVAVYTLALQPSSVAAQAARKRTMQKPQESPLALVLWLNFDESVGDKAFDGSGLGNDALLGDGIAASMPERILDP